MAGMGTLRIYLSGAFLGVHKCGVKVFQLHRQALYTVLQKIEKGVRLWQEL